MFEVTQCQYLEEYVIEMGENEEEFIKVLLEVLEDNPRKNELVLNLKNLWVESNVLHRTAIFIRQSFADRISRAEIVDPTNKDSKLARNLLMIDTEPAQGIYLNTDGYVTNIETLALLFIKRESFIIQDNKDSAEEIDEDVLKGFNGDEQELDKLWSIIRTVILE